MEKLLSVSIAAYNVEKYIRETLDSFITESMDKIEVLIVDDGGSDGTVEIAEEYENRYPNTFRLIRKENGGWGSTVNSGIDHAHGKYFKLLDGDDYFDKDGLEKLLSYLSQVDTDLIYTYYRIFQDGGQGFEDVRFPENYCVGKVIPINEVDVMFPFRMHGCVFRTELLKKNNVRITEHTFYTDMEYLVKGLVYTQTVSFLDVVVYMYRMGMDSQSVSNAGYRKHRKDHERVLKTLLHIYDDLDEDIPSAKVIKHMVGLMVGYQYKVYLIQNNSKAAANRLKSFDGFIRKRYPEFVSNGKRIKVFRIFGKYSFPIIRIR